jgi:undecaprenyl diphosphate synthase
MTELTTDNRFTGRIPRHVAVVMDGNGRWAEARGDTRAAGHRAGLEPVRMCIRECLRHGIGLLTVFAFSSENWQRPEAEVRTLMNLFMESLDREVDELAANGVAMRFIGDRQALAVRLQQRILAAEQRLGDNRKLLFQVAVSYGGRWDIVTAAQALARQCQSGALRPEDIDEQRFAAGLALGPGADPDLFIRTGGEHRISNFLLWNLAYTELWFSERLWPDFSVGDFAAALEAYAARERRFGRTGRQARHA